MRLVAVLAVLLAACGADHVTQSHLPVGAACTLDTECQSARCLDGKCRLRCENDAECQDDTLSCQRGGCLPKPAGGPVCGNGTVEAPEECDDHNTKSDDGCSATCRIEAAVAAWHTGNWTACSNTCGEGTHARSVTCEAGGETVPDGRCPQPKPTTIEECTDRSGCTCSPTTCSGTCTLADPGEFPVILPADCRAVTIEAWGGGGAGGNQQGATGGGGGYATAKLAVTGGETLAIEVAEGGQHQGDGGGASSVKRGATPLVVAAGGGGGSDGCSGCATGGAGGAGGGAAGEDGADLTNGASGSYCQSATGGKGGTAETGGLGGHVTGVAENQCSGGQGGPLAGGPANGVNGQCNPSAGPNGWHAGGGQGNGGGGAGGSGWFGGGGAGFIWTYCAGGGGGGSSYVAPGATNTQLLGGTRRQAGSAATANGAAAGGNVGGTGGNGRVVVHFGG